MNIEENTIKLIICLNYISQGHSSEISWLYCKRRLMNNIIINNHNNNNELWE